MTKYDFDKIIDRRNTDCLKYDFAIQRGRPADVLPFWVKAFTAIARAKTMPVVLVSHSALVLQLKCLVYQSRTA